MTNTKEHEVIMTKTSNLISGETDSNRHKHFTFLPLISRVLSIFEDNMFVHRPVTLDGHTAGLRFRSLTRLFSSTQHTQSFECEY